MREYGDVFIQSIAGNVICANGVSFSVVLSADITVADVTEVRLTGFTEYYDDGNNFDPVTGIYTIPFDGVYQFIVNVNLGATTTLNDVLVLVRLKRNFFIFDEGDGLPVFTDSLFYYEKGEQENVQGNWNDNYSKMGDFHPDYRCRAVRLLS